MNGKQYPLPGQALIEKKWQLVAIQSYNSTNKLWTVMNIEGERSIFNLPRIFVRFFAEDPRIFADRIENVLSERQRAENNIA